MGAADLVIEKIQELLDCGYSPTKTAAILGLDHKQVDRAIKKHGLEIYIAFDEECDNKHLYQNFEWLWQEDWLEINLVNKSFDSKALLVKSENEDVLSVGVYVRERYGDLKSFFVEKGFKRLINYVSVECSSCKKFKALSGWYPDKRKPWGLMGECPDCRRKLSQTYNESNPEKIFANAQKRRNMAELLLNEFTKEDWVNARKAFGWKCAITKNTGSISLDHFIPVILGHGGTYLANLIPIKRSLNCSKKDRNPFIWSGKNGHRLEKIIKYLAKQNSLTESEYIDFVNWCFDNPRNADEVRDDRRQSIEIWREATGRHFPLPKYALDEIGNRSTDETVAATVSGKEAQ